MWCFCLLVGRPQASNKSSLNFFTDGQYLIDSYSGHTHTHTHPSIRCSCPGGVLTEVVEAPLGAEADLALQVVRVLRPGLQDGEAIADARLAHRQLVLTWETEASQIDVGAWGSEAGRGTERGGGGGGAGGYSLV